jgi:hypothetical protein
MPIEGSDFTINIEAPEDLTGAAVTIEYRMPNNQILDGIEPTDVDEESNIITYSMANTITTKGTWKVWAKIVNTDGKITYTEPPESVNFKGRGL